MKYVKTFGEFVNESRINESIKSIEKEIDNALYKFDEKNHEYRYKHFDTQENNGDWFVNWVTQEDEFNDGEPAMMKILAKIAKKNKIDIYLYYIIRDNDRTSNYDMYSKKGYKKVN